MHSFILGKTVYKMQYKFTFTSFATLSDTDFSEQRRIILEVNHIEQVSHTMLDICN